jgi:hypothetical protein
MQGHEVERRGVSRAGRGTWGEGAQGWLVRQAWGSVGVRQGSIGGLDFGSR